MSEKKTVFMSIGADVIHGGHIEIIHRAAELGELMADTKQEEDDNDLIGKEDER